MVRLGRPCLRIAQVPAKEIRLVSDLEVLQAVAAGSLPARVLQFGGKFTF
jgi:hypothetical protein